MIEWEFDRAIGRADPVLGAVSEEQEACLAPVCSQEWPPHIAAKLFK